MSVYFHPIYNAVLSSNLPWACSDAYCDENRDENGPCVCLERGVYHSCRSDSVAMSEGVMRISTEMTREMKSSLFHWIYSFLCIRFYFHLTDTLQTYFLLFSLVDFLLLDGPIQALYANWPSCLSLDSRLSGLQLTTWAIYTFGLGKRLLSARPIRTRWAALRQRGRLKPQHWLDTPTLGLTLSVSLLPFRLNRHTASSDELFWKSCDK